MKFLNNTVAMIGIATMLWGCFSEPVFDDSPRITLERLEFKRSTSDQAPRFDTLAVTVAFEDGDGDLGLRDVDNADVRYSPIHFFDSVSLEPLTDRTSRALRWGFIDRSTERAIKTTNVDFSSLNIADYDDIARCPNEFYDTAIVSSQRIDLFVVRRNLDTDNFFVDIFTRNADGDFELFDWSTANPNVVCGDRFVHGRFEYLKENINEKSPLEGSITYKIQSSGFVTLFGTQELRIEARINDRALNTSNTVVGIGTLDELLRGEFERP